MAFGAAIRRTEVEVEHIEAAANLARVRGVGEGGTLGPAAVLANTVADALGPGGAEPDEVPLTPARVWGWWAGADPPPSGAGAAR